MRSAKIQKVFGFDKEFCYHVLYFKDGKRLNTTYHNDITRAIDNANAWDPNFPVKLGS